MDFTSPLVCGPIQVTWDVDGSVNTITYDSIPLIQAVNQRFKSSGMQGLQDLIEELLDTVATISTNDMRQKIFLADKIFEHFRLETRPPNPKLQVQSWNSIIAAVWAWEDSHEKVHKGTAYYFMAASYLGLGDVPSAYICFFNALEDDKRNFPFIPKNLKDAPAYRTTSLVDNPKNALYLPVVVPLRQSLQNFINGYNVRTKENFDMQALDQKFLQADPLEDIKRFFVATFHEIYHLSPLNSSRMINNDYSKLKVIDTLFNLGLIVDQILEYRFLQNAEKEEKKMANAVYHLALHHEWITRLNVRDVGEFLKKVKPNLKGSPNKVLPRLLDGKATFDNVPMNAKMSAIFVAYHLRNYAAHHLEGSDILINRYNDVLDRIMDAFFVSIESL